MMKINLPGVHIAKAGTAWRIRIGRSVFIRKVGKFTVITIGRVA